MADNYGYDQQGGYQHPQGYNQGYNQGYDQGYDQGYNQGYNQPDNYYYNYNNQSGKSKMAAGLLAIFLGGLGIQYFYLGKTSAGIWTILISLVTCGAFEIVTLIQGIYMLTLSDQDFDQKYVYTTKSFPLF